MKTYQEGPLIILHQYLTPQNDPVMKQMGATTREGLSAEAKRTDTRDVPGDEPVVPGDPHSDPERPWDEVDERDGTTNGSNRDI